MGSVCKTYFSPARKSLELIFSIEPNLKIDGILLTLVDNRTNLAKSTMDALRHNFGRYIRMYQSTIPINISLSLNYISFSKGMAEAAIA